MPEGLPGLDALAHVCRAFGLNHEDAQLLHHRSNAVYLLPHEQVVARLAPDTPLRQTRAGTVIAVSRWLASRPEPIALPPVPGNQPTTAGGAIATFWPYQATNPEPTVEDLAGLLRRLHTLPPPPFPVPPYRPLHRLDEALQLDCDRDNPVLSTDDHAWLAARSQALIDTFATTKFPLETGLVHADAHDENLVRHGTGWVLIDWDQACVGPRELDLLAGLPDHFHQAESTRTAFLTAYGYNLLDWPGWTLLRDIAELHSLASYIRLAPHKPAAATELHRRVHSLRTGDQSVRWHAIS